MKKIWLLCLLLVTPLIKVDALYCSTTESAYLKRLASNVSYSYEPVESDSVTFSITLTNLQDKFYVVDNSSGRTYNYTNNEITISGYDPGSKIKYEIYANNADCTGVLYTILVSLPSYNPYYTDSVCDGVTGYDLCQKWSNHGLSYESFRESVINYKNQNTVIEEPIIVEENDNSSVLWDIVLKYYYVPLILVILISSIEIYCINKRDNIYN